MKKMLYSLVAGAVACAPSGAYVVGCEYESNKELKLQGISAQEVANIAQALLFAEQGYAWKGVNGEIMYRSREGRVVEAMQSMDLSQKILECDLNDDGVLTKEEMEQVVARSIGQACWESF